MCARAVAAEQAEQRLPYNPAADSVLPQLRGMILICRVPKRCYEGRKKGNPVSRAAAGLNQPSFARTLHSPRQPAQQQPALHQSRCCRLALRCDANGTQMAAGAAGHALGCSSICKKNQSVKGMQIRILAEGLFCRRQQRPPPLEATRDSCLQQAAAAQRSGLT